MLRLIEHVVKAANKQGIEVNVCGEMSGEPIYTMLLLGLGVLAVSVGGLITTAISWRAAFVFQALVIVVIVVLGRSLVDPVPADPARPFDIVGAVLSAVGLVVLVGGILAADQNLVLMAVLLVAGALILAGFYVLMNLCADLAAVLLSARTRTSLQ